MALDHRKQHADAAKANDKAAAINAENTAKKLKAKADAASKAKTDDKDKD